MTATATTMMDHLFPLLSTGPSMFFPEQASSVAPDIDALFWAIFWICAIFFVLIVGATLLFMIVYRRSKHPTPQPSQHHNMRLEIVWSVIPLVLLVVICLWSLVVYWEIVTPPTGGTLKEIHVNATKWNWEFVYPVEDVKVNRELHVVKGERTQLIMNSADVTHSLYIPAFRVKQDVIPGRYTTLWFEATMPGSFPLYCTEYCGMNHSDMTAKVVVHEDKAAFDAWMSSQNEDALTDLQLGQKRYTEKCQMCHSIAKDTKIVGPSFFGLYGKTEEMKSGETVVVDEAYLIESMKEPSKRLVKGYEGGMTPFDKLSDREYRAIIEFIKAQK